MAALQNWDLISPPSDRWPKVLTTSTTLMFTVCASRSEVSTYIIKLLSTVDLMLIDKRQHDPITDDGALIEKGVWCGVVGE